jgi:hypothetical protein
MSILGHTYSLCCQNIHFSPHPHSSSSLGIIKYWLMGKFCPNINFINFLISLNWAVIIDKSHANQNRSAPHISFPPLFIFTSTYLCILIFSNFILECGTTVRGPKWFSFSRFIWIGPPVCMQLSNINFRMFLSRIRIFNFFNEFIYTYISLFI